MQKKQAASADSMKSYSAVKEKDGARIGITQRDTLKKERADSNGKCNGSIFQIFYSGFYDVFCFVQPFFLCGQRGRTSETNQPDTGRFSVCGTVSVLSDNLYPDGQNRIFVFLCDFTDRHVFRAACLWNGLSRHPSAACESDVHAFDGWFYYADKAGFIQGGPPADDYNCLHDACYGNSLYHPKMENTAEADMGLRNTRYGCTFHRSFAWKHYKRLQNYVYDCGNYVSAVRICKAPLPVFLASALARDQSFRQICIAGVCAAVHVLVLVLSRDLGSALIYFAVYVFLIYIASGKLRYFLLGGVGGCGAAYVAYRLFSHVQVRVTAWRDPWSVIDREGFQIAQSLFAMGRGSWFGLGIGKGTPKDIPFVDTDFIFAAVTEEMGLIFAVSLLAVCLACFIQFLQLAASLKDNFYRNLAAGGAVMYIFQIFLTVGGGTKFIPLTGVTLPLVSYGGSSVAATLMLFAVIQGIYLVKKEETEQGAKKKRRSAGRRLKDEQFEEENEYSEESVEK